MRHQSTAIDVREIVQPLNHSQSRQSDQSSCLSPLLPKEPELLAGCRALLPCRDDHGLLGKQGAAALASHFPRVLLTWRGI